jgi:hypothetical protein
MRIYMARLGFEMPWKDGGKKPLTHACSPPPPSLRPRSQQRLLQRQVQE